MKNDSLPGKLSVDRSMLSESIMSKLKKRKNRVAVFGLGRVGLPKAVIIADAGFQVVGVDIDSKIVETVSKGQVRTTEPRLQDMIKRVTHKGFLRATADGDLAARHADVFIVCVQTPIQDDKSPDLSYIQNACKTIAQSLNPGKLVIIASTIPPKSTKKLIVPLLEKISKLKCGSDFWFAYCPERAAPGRVLKELSENDVIIGGYNDESSLVTAEFFKTFVKGQIIVTEATAAEVAKLAENTFRDVNIAFANQLALICEQSGLDVTETIKLANTHPRVKIHKPGTGVGGPCLPKDPYLLIYKANLAEQNLIKSARQTNDAMPKHMTKLIVHALKQTGRNVNASKIAILGTAYKADIDDSMQSASKQVIEELLSLGAEVKVYDPYCNQLFGAKKAETIQDAARDSDCIVILTEHTVFKDLDFHTIKKLMRENPLMVDGRRILDPHRIEELGFNYYGIGLGKASYAESP